MLHRWKEKWRDAKLSKKLTALYLAVTGILCAAIFAALQVSFDIYDGFLYEKSLQELDFFANRIGDELQDIEDFTASLAVDESLQRQLDELKRTRYPSYEYNYKMYQLRQLLLGKLLAERQIESLIYVDPYGTLLTVGSATPAWSKEEKAALLAELGGARGGYVEHAPTGAYPYLLGGRAVLKRLDMSMKPLGYLIVTCDVEAMVARQKSSLEAEHAALFVYSGETMLYQSQEDIPALLPACGSGQGYDIVQYRGQRYFLSYLTMGRSGWMLADLFPYAEIFGAAQGVRSITLLGFALLFALSAVLIRRFAQRVTRPLGSLSDAITIVETGDFARARAALPPAPAQDEVGLLTQEFDAMLARIDALIEEDYKKQLVLRDSKYRILQSQKNPHFLYNTLNTLSWLIRAGRSEDAAHMTVELGEMLRASLKRESFTTVAQDVALVRNYIAIQQLRYRSRAAFTVSADGALERYILPHITLQPLVENAISYGVEESLSLCHVDITVEERADSIRMQVRDSGPGMDAERLAAVRSGSYRPNGHGIGINNIRERLTMLFGPQAVFEIESALGKGTTVTLEFPKKTEVSDVQAADR